MKQQRINLERKIDDSYDLVIGTDLLLRIAENLRQKQLGTKYAIITDSNVRRLYADKLSDALNSEGLRNDIFYFRAGERSKRLGTCEALADRMSAEGYGRDCAVIALGGGVVTDMAGFIASGFNRGVPLVMVPSSLVAQADASIGGKTGVDTEHGKNLFGTFYQPKKVWLDIALLQTLPVEEIRNGLAETIKHGVIADKELFEYLNSNIEGLLAKTEADLLHIAEKNCVIKGNVVMADPDEKGMRRILNFGHTIGHAIEKLSGYKISHGPCVSIGMMAEARIAQKVTGFDSVRRLEELLAKTGLPVKIPSGMCSEAIMEAVKLDKKSKDHRPRYCLPTRIGHMSEFKGEYADYVNDKTVKKALQAAR
jgi:3-dehydroquinate synthase